MPYLHWLLVLMYIVPIIGTFVAMIRRFGSFWSISESIRKLWPSDRFSRKVFGWSDRWRAWRDSHPLANYVNVNQLNYAAGCVEYAFGHLRDYTIGLYMMTAAVVYLTLMVFGSDAYAARYFDRLFYHGFFALLSIWTYRRHVTTGLQMTEFMRANPRVHPQEFFEHYYRRLGPAATPIPGQARGAIDPHDISFKSGKKPRQSYWLLIHAFYDTAIFARSATKAMQTLGPQYGREVFDVMAQLWGKRILQLFRAQLQVKGDELFNQLDGKIILIFNHKSHLDFVFNFFALSVTKRADGRPILPRYMAAKDHFLDNRLIYEGIGVGKLIESVDMVFVDRKGKGKDAIAQAADRLASKEIEIAMYPQGTRVFGNKGWNGERQDAGYYTSGSLHSLQQEMGHLKKGAVFLALDTAIAVRHQDIPVHLVFIGIEGTATLAPKGSFKVETEGTVLFNVSGVVTLHTSDVANLTKPSGPATTAEETAYLEKATTLQREIDAHLIEALGLHEKLKNRFLDDARHRTLTPKEDFFRLTHRLQQAKQTKEELPFTILDRIYALDPTYWEARLKEIAHWLTSVEDPSAELMSLRDQVTEQLFATRGKLMKKTEDHEKLRQKIKKSA